MQLPGSMPFPSLLPHISTFMTDVGRLHWLSALHGRPSYNELCVSIYPGEIVFYPSGVVMQSSTSHLLIKDRKSAIVFTLYNKDPFAKCTSLVVKHRSLGCGCMFV